jgi:hypothetical protein
MFCSIMMCTKHFLSNHQRTTMKVTTTGSTQGKAKTMWLYGDLVRSLIAGVAAPFISYQYFLLPEDHPKKPWALLAAIAITTTGVLQYLSWWIGRTPLLYVASLCHLSFFVYIEMIAWPLEGECTMAQNVVGTMLMINANVGVNPLHKAVLMVASVCAGYFVISVSPFVSNVEDELPFLLAALWAISCCSTPLAIRGWIRSRRRGCCSRPFSSITSCNYVRHSDCTR